MTVGALVDQVFRTYLEPPDAQPARTELTEDIDAVVESFTIGAFEIPEDVNLLRVGSVLEHGLELMRVSNYDSTTQTVTVKRGFLGSTAEAATNGDLIKFSPPFPRQDVFNAVRNNIVALYPKLWTTTIEYLSEVSPGVYPIEDELVTEIVEVNPEGAGGHTLEINGRISEYKLEAGGRAFITNSGYGDLLVARLRRRFGVALSEDTTYEEVALEAVWEPVVMAGAASEMLAGRDIPSAHTEWVQAALEAESIQVGTRQSLAVGLARYRELLIDRFAAEMIAEDSNKIAVEMTNPFTQVV